VVVGGPQDPDRLRQINEDLAVMALILGQAVEGPDSAEAGASGPGEPVTRLRVCRIQAFYLQDYGVAFSVWTGSDLPVRDRIELQMGAEPNDLRDPVWEQARRRLLSDPLPSHTPDSKGPAPMDLEQDFKARLVVSLQHASNIRHLASQHWVTLVLTGQTADLQQGAVPSVGHVAVLRIQKQTLDDYVSRLLDPSQFQAKVQIALQ
jgi:hypothetical protein